MLVDSAKELKMCVQEYS